ncbi:MAG: hypothetical protein ACR2FJ_00330 [Qipengyuania sp.]
MRCTVILLFAAGAMLAGCASAEGQYPSLAVRDVERVQGRFEPIESAPLDVPEVQVDLAGGLDARLASLLTQARAAHEEFVASTPAAANRAAAASGAAIGSDAWAAAQVALADLDSIRSRTAIALGDLDILYIAASVQAEERGAIDVVRERVIAIVSEEDEALAQLRARVR